MSLHDASDSQMQLLVLEISCGKNLTEEVVVNCGDTAHDVAKAFTNKHKMKHHAMKKIEKHIEQCLDQYLSAHPQEKAMHEAMLEAKKNPLTSPLVDEFSPSLSNFEASLPVSPSKSDNDSENNRYDDLKKWWGDARTDDFRASSETDVRSNPQSSEKHSVSGQSSSSLSSGARGRDSFGGGGQTFPCFRNPIGKATHQRGRPRLSPLVQVK